MKYLKTYETIFNKLIYKIGDYIKYSINMSNDSFGRIIDMDQDKFRFGDDEPSTLYTVITKDGKTKILWQTSTDGEIKDYWNISSIEKEEFEQTLQQNLLANKFNI